MRNSLFTLTNNQVLKRIVFVIPIFVVFQIILTKIVFGIGNEFYVEATIEDGPVEYATSIIYFASFVFSLAISKSFKNSKNFAVLFLILGIGFFFIAMEEISWGQRIFNWTNPDWFPKNIQEESNIHNLEGVSQFRSFAYLAVGLYGTLGWYVIPKILNKPFINSGSNYIKFLRYAVPSKYLIGYFLPILVFSMILILASQNIINEEIRWNFFHQFDSEPLELILSVGIFLFIINSFSKIRKKEQ